MSTSASASACPPSIGRVLCRHLAAQPVLQPVEVEDQIGVRGRIRADDAVRVRRPGQQLPVLLDGDRPSRWVLPGDARL